MRATTCLRLLLVALALVGCQTVAARGAGNLEGAWTAVASEREGASVDELKGHRLTFGRGTFAITRGSTTLYQGTYTVDAGREPASIDFVHTAGDARGQTWRGIYVIAGDTLRITDNAPDVTKPRPTTLAAPKGSGYTSLVFKRLAGG